MPNNATPPPIDDAGYLDLLLRLLPRGPLWGLSDDSTLRGALYGLAAELARVHSRILQLLEEADPRTADETIEAWERVLQLPDPAIGQLATLAERQAFAHARWIASGGQTAAYYIELAAALGYTITITEPCQPFRVGIGRAGDALYSEDWAYGWRVTATNGPIVIFRAGYGRAGYRLKDARIAVLEALISRYAPAHTIPVFEYQP